MNRLRPRIVLTILMLSSAATLAHNQTSYSIVHRNTMETEMTPLVPQIHQGVLLLQEPHRIHQSVKPAAIQYRCHFSHFRAQN